MENELWRINKMFNHLRRSVGLLPLLLASCGSGIETKTELSDVLTEDAIVSEIVYMPSRHGSGSGIGPTMDFDGNIGFAFSSVSVSIPEKYAVVFKCQHGKFISEGTDQRHKDLWQRLSEGHEVVVTYKEIFKSTYQDTDGDGKKEVIKRELVAYDFLDAQPKEGGK